MRRYLRRMGALAPMLTLLVLFMVSPAGAQTPDGRYFAQTGHWVAGAFYDVYRAQPLAEALYGYPLTEAFVDTQTGYLVQFFQQAYFQLKPELPPGQQVVRVELGRLLYEPGGKVNLTRATPGCTQHPGWEHPICYDFYEFYQELGAEAVFGPPVSGLEVHGNMLWQYFANARLEWHPELPPGARITIAHLGAQYFLQRAEQGWINTSLLLPVAEDLRPQYDITGLVVHAFAQHSQIPLGQTQTLVVTVRDQSRAALLGASVSATLILPDGFSQPLGAILTNKNGVATFEFLPQANQVGVAEIIVTVRHQNITEHARTSFRIWY